jgi:hypothetical protein
VKAGGFASYTTAKRSAGVNDKKGSKATVENLISSISTLVFVNIGPYHRNSYKIYFR